MPTGLNPAEWTPRELRHSFVSLLSDNGIPLEEISRLVGHSSTAVTEAVYRKQIRPVLQPVPMAMDRIFVGRSGAIVTHLVTAEGPSRSGRGPLLVRLVGATGFEPATSCSQSKRAAKLRHAPLRRLRTRSGTPVRLRPDDRMKSSPEFDRFART